MTVGGSWVFLSMVVVKEYLADQHHITAYTGDMAAIEVGTGPVERTFYAHCDLLSFYSGYFKASLNGGLEETQSRVAKLDNEKPAVFEEFVMWLYTNKARTDETTLGPFFRSVVKLCIFADRRVIPLLTNKMVDHLQQSVLIAWVVPTNTITEVYINTTEQSALRHMMVDINTSLASKELASIMTHDANDHLENFFVDLVKSLIASTSRKLLLSKEQYQQVEMCPSFHFHVHEEGVTCAKTGTKTLQ
jgi:hypothetical protein